jgi:TolA-binding protein
LARVHLRQGDRTKLLGDLAMLAANDADDLDVRRNLAEEFLKSKDFAQAAKWATECLYIQVYDPAHHVILGDALAGQDKPAEAAEEYAVALELKPKKTADIRIKLARALRADGRMAEARATLDEVLDADPDHPEAKALRDEFGAADDR